MVLMDEDPKERDEKTDETAGSDDAPDAAPDAAGDAAGDAADSASLMYVVCAKCRKFLEVRPGPIEAMTHTYCEDCYHEMMKEIERATGKPPPEEDA